MKRILSLFLVMILILCTPVLAEDDSQARIDSGIVGVWIETEDYGTLTMRADGTATMVYYDGIVSDCNWELTEEGGRFTDGMWFGSPIYLENENVLNVADGWMRFTREGVEIEMPETDWTELDPVPVGEEGVPFLGEWTLEAIEMDGASMDPGLMGMEMTLILTEDGLVTIDDGWDSMTDVWYVEDGAAIVDGMPMTLREDGKLVMEEDGAAMVFTQGEVTTGEGELSDDELLLLLLGMMASTEESDLPEEHQGFAGEWYLCYCNADGLSGDLRPLSISVSLSIYDDYTGSLWCFPTMNDSEEDSDKLLRDLYETWFDEEGTIYFGEELRIPMYLLGDEESPAGIFLQYGTEKDGYLIFSQDEEAVWDPEAYTLQPVEADEPAEPAVSEPAQVSTGEGPLNVRYVCTEYTAAGFTADASTLGAEYSVIFYDDGTADFTMSGILMPGLPYAITEEGVYAIDYYGMSYNFTPTDAGFDLDYFGTMTMHLVPET